MLARQTRHVFRAHFLRRHLLDLGKAAQATLIFDLALSPQEMAPATMPAKLCYCDTC